MLLLLSYYLTTNSKEFDKYSPKKSFIFLVSLLSWSQNVLGHQNFYLIMNNSRKCCQQIKVQSI